ncbi:MAG: hypothetical protein ACK56I_10370, partial [bacterium]
VRLSHSSPDGPTARIPAAAANFFRALSLRDALCCSAGGSAVSNLLRNLQCPANACLVKADADKCYYRIDVNQAKEALRRQAARLGLSVPRQFANGWTSVDLLVDAMFAEGQMFLGGDDVNRQYGQLLGLSMGGSL